MHDWVNCTYLCKLQMLYVRYVLCIVLWDESVKGTEEREERGGKEEGR